MKIYIQDHLKAHRGELEKELTIDTNIRYHIGNTTLTVKLTDEGIEIYKTNNKYNEESRIMAIGNASNVIIVK